MYQMLLRERCNACKGNVNTQAIRSIASLKMERTNISIIRVWNSTKD